MTQHSPSPENSAWDQRSAAKQAAEAARTRAGRRRSAALLGLGAVVILAGLAALGITAFGWLDDESPVDTTAEGGASIPAELQDIALPAGAFPVDHPYSLGVPEGTDPQAPVVELYEDFQCPACATFEEQGHQVLAEATEQGTILLVFRPATFLDRSGGTASLDAAAAYGCAVDAGIGSDYRKTIYANQSERTDGMWNDGALVRFAKASGLTGKPLADFETCVAEAFASGRPRDRQKKLDELLEVFDRFGYVQRR